MIKFFIPDYKDVGEITKLINNEMTLGKTTQGEILNTIQHGQTLCAKKKGKIIGFTSAIKIVDELELDLILQDNMKYKDILIESNYEEIVYINNLAVHSDFRDGGVGISLIKLLMVTVPLTTIFTLLEHTSEKSISTELFKQVGFLLTEPTLYKTNNEKEVYVKLAYKIPQ